MLSREYVVSAAACEVMERAERAPRAVGEKTEEDRSSSLGCMEGTAISGATGLGFSAV